MNNHIITKHINYVGRDDLKEIEHDTDYDNSVDPPSGSDDIVAHKPYPTEDGYEITGGTEYDSWIWGYKFKARKYFAGVEVSFTGYGNTAEEACTDADYFARDFDPEKHKQTGVFKAHDVIVQKKMRGEL